MNYKLKILFVIFLALPLITIGQSKRDYIWFLGKDQQVEPGIQGMRMDFNITPMEPQVAINGLEFDQQQMGICDEEGNLLFYTNGCAIANAQDEIMPNGDSINAGVFFDELWLGDCGNGYPGSQNIVTLPDPNNSLGYYAIHKTVEYKPNQDPQVSIDHLKYSYIDMNLDDGKGDVVEKNVIFATAPFLSAYLVSISHENGRDYWIIQPEENSNIYHKYLLDETGIHLNDKQEIGPEFHFDASAGGVSRVSPDGKMYAYHNRFDQLLLYDFDRSTGQLSNLRQLSFELTPIFTSIEFSSNSRFLYVMGSEELYQVDLHSEILEEGVELIDIYNGAEDPFPSTFVRSGMGPDCRIYIRPSSSTRSFHVINKPNEKGKACNFVQGAIKLPQVTAVGSFPNHPVWRVDEEEKCDPFLTTLFGEPVYYTRNLHAFPNPTEGPVQIEIPDQGNGYLYVYDMNGNPVQAAEQVSSQRNISLDLRNSPSGQYIIEYLPKDNPERIIYQSKVVKQ